MSTYRLLQDHYVNGRIFQAGTTQSTADVGGLFPIGWIPTPNVDPLDTAAVTAFYARGPVSTGLVRSTLVGINVAPPVTYWKNTGTSRSWSPEFSGEFGPIGHSALLWSLTGLGVQLAPIGI